MNLMDILLPIFLLLGIFLYVIFHEIGHWVIASKYFQQDKLKIILFSIPPRIEIDATNYNKSKTGFKEDLKTLTKHNFKIRIAGFLSSFVLLMIICGIFGSLIWNYYYNEFAEYYGNNITYITYWHFQEIIYEALIIRNKDLS